MHLIIPGASALDESAAAALRTLTLPVLPNLAALLGRLGRCEQALGSDEWALDAPFELALATARGWGVEPGGLPGLPGLPFAAASALADGVDVAGDAWALLTPLHLSIGSDQVVALEPEALDAEASRRLLEDLAAELFPAAEQWRYAFGATQRWYVAHPDFANAQSASLERILNRGVDSWLPQARRLRTVQNEVQMLLHRHPLNAEREARGQLPVNSVWISGCGVARTGALPADLQIDERLRAPLQTGDWAAWLEAWRALDAGPIAEFLERAKRGEQNLALTLCGDRFARRYVPHETHALTRLWQRMVPPQADVISLLAQL